MARRECRSCGRESLIHSQQFKEAIHQFFLAFKKRSKLTYIIVVEHGALQRRLSGGIGLHNSFSSYSVGTTFRVGWHHFFTSDIMRCKGSNNPRNKHQKRTLKYVKMSYSRQLSPSLRSLNFTGRGIKCPGGRGRSGHFPTLFDSGGRRGSD